MRSCRLLPGLNQGKTANRHCSNACRPCASGDTASQYLREAPPPPKFPPPPELSAAPGWLPESPPEAVAEAAALSRPSAATPAAVAATVTARSTPSSSDERCWAIPKKTGSRKSFSRAMIRPPNTPVIRRSSPPRVEANHAFRLKTSCGKRPPTPTNTRKNTIRPRAR